ncbi:MAG: hypothetical protein AAGA93_24595 [Actinomycetota bacterium]
MPPSSATSPVGRPRRRPGSTLLRVLAPALLVALLAAACGPSDSSDGAAGETDPGAVEETTADGAGDDGAEAGVDGDVPPGLVDGSVTVVVPNSPGTLSTVGQQRVMAALLGEGPNAYLGGPDVPVTVRFSSLDADLTEEVDGEWLTTDASSLGLYVAPVAFARAGLWEVTVLAGDQEVGGALIEVVEESAVPNVGDPAPATVTPTGETAEEIAAISTDPEPEAGFYDLSIDEAVANGRPTVIAFATPAFCRTALCGPTIESVKAATVDRDELDVVHVEPFDLELAPQGTLEPLPVMLDWNLLTEPWVFVVDADGLITASFEGIIGQGELERAIDQLPSS